MKCQYKNKSADKRAAQEEVEYAVCSSFNCINFMDFCIMY